MKKKNRLKAWIIFGIYFAATCALIFGCYGIQKPAVAQQEFPFTLTYSYQGTTQTISDVYVAEHSPVAKYIGDDAVTWYGYVKDRNRLEADYYTVAEADGQVFSINLNMEPGYLMGDPRYADSVCQPTAVCHITDGSDQTTISDPVELEQMGFAIVSWEYPDPVENQFSFGGISLSSEAVIYTAAIAAAALLACMILIRKEPGLEYGMLDKVSVVLNFLVTLGGFPFILIASALSEIVADTSVLQQILYLSPALTALGVAASVTLRRMGRKTIGFWIQFAGPIAFGLGLLCEYI